MVFRYNGFFFRGYLLKDLPTGYQMLSIDFAFIITVSVEDIFPLVDLFSIENYPMFACLCSLDNIMPASKTWSPLALYL